MNTTFQPHRHQVAAHRALIPRNSSELTSVHTVTAMLQS